jgi:RNA polymerase sigma-70 factor (ECF subfamily)
MEDVQSQLEALYRDKYANFRNVLAAVTGSSDSARDVVQEAFVVAMSKHRDFRGTGSLEGWVWRIALRLAVHESRRQLTRAAPLADLPSAVLVERDVDPTLAAAVRALPERRRLVVFLRYFGDHSYTEIAEICGISEGTVAATISAAHRELRDLLASEDRPTHGVMR